MFTPIKTWIRGRYQKVINSISFYPAFIAILFLIFSSLMILFDFSDKGKTFKSQLHWLTLKDASTARSIISSVVAGIISLTVFSFSMVMIVLNQAASQMSNRVLDKLIGNRFQQIVLGIYIGTIVYALFLLSTIRDIDSGIYIPALSVYMLIAITIFDIFLFIYFLHYITQSVKYEVIIDRICKDTMDSLKKTCNLGSEPDENVAGGENIELVATTSGIYEGFDKKAMMALCDDHDLQVILPYIPGTFVLKGAAVIYINKKVNDEVTDSLLEFIYLHTEESIDSNFFYGFHQLMEIAVKALSPGINDPATASVSLRALFQLLVYRVKVFPSNNYKNEKGKVRIMIKELHFDKIFADTILPIWDYGKEDRTIQKELHHLLKQFLSIAPNQQAAKLLQAVKARYKGDDL